jgi:hypothetical protein
MSEPRAELALACLFCGGELDLDIDWDNMRVDGIGCFSCAAIWDRWGALLHGPEFENAGLW